MSSTIDEFATTSNSAHDFNFSDSEDEADNNNSLMKTNDDINKTTDPKIKAEIKKDDALCETIPGESFANIFADIISQSPTLVLNK